MDDKDPPVKDLGEDQVTEWGKQRDRWWYVLLRSSSSRQLWRPRKKPPSPPRRLQDAPVTPFATASIFSQLTFSWITPLMVLGYQRPLQATDLWKLPDEQASLAMSMTFLASLDRRQKAAAEWNASHDKKRFGSVAWALNDTITGFWIGGLFKVVGDASALMAPLIIKEIIRFSQKGRCTVI